VGRAVGIDLGTTFSAVAALEASGKAVVLPNRHGAHTTPSVVLFDDHGGQDVTVVGVEAKAQAADRPDDVVQRVKRFMADKSWQFDSENGGEYSAEEVSAIILRHLVEYATTALGEPITHAVITVPAYFDDARRVATRDAGRLAGLEVLGLLNEPTAAAIDYGVKADEDGYVLVYDLGGGTFDVTILEIHDREFRVAATDGDRNLGGFDWDNALITLVQREMAKLPELAGIEGDVDALAAVRESCEKAKRRLSTAQKAKVVVNRKGAEHRINVTREQFEDATVALRRRTQELVEDVLDASGLSWDDIGQTMLVGGSTRMPAIRDLVATMSGKTPIEGVDPDEAVARGAAIRAAGLQSDSPVATPATAPPAPEVTVRDVTSQALGTIAMNFDTNAAHNFVVTARNTPVPSTGHRSFETLRDLERLTIEITQGEDPDPSHVTVIGEAVFPLGEIWPAGTPYVLIYSYDIDQQVHVEVRRDLGGPSVGTFRIERVANLTQEQLVEAAEKLDHLAVASARAAESASPTASPPVNPPSPAPPPVALPSTRTSGSSQASAQ
jgi:molecular chaperone DnaK